MFRVQTLGKERQVALSRAFVKKPKQAAYAPLSLRDKLLTDAPKLSEICPLFFATPTSRLVKTDKEKQDELEAGVAAKEAPYQLTAQYVHSVAAFLPELINNLVSFYVIKNHNKLAYNKTKHLIKNIY